MHVCIRTYIHTYMYVVPGTSTYIFGLNSLLTSSVSLVTHLVLLCSSVDYYLINVTWSVHCVTASFQQSCSPLAYTYMYLGPSSAATAQ